jgi:hypothetical protein
MTRAARRAAQARADGLLSNAIPVSIAARLMRGEDRIAESYPATTVLFAPPGRVHVAPARRELLGGSWTFEAREPIEVKGMGRMATYLLGSEAAADRLAADGAARSTSVPNDRTDRP